MSDLAAISTVAISKTLSIRECGFDEDWLQEQIYCNPFILGLGGLEIDPKQQLNDGTFDLLLKDSEDQAVYVVGIMVGELDENHIIRTIESWDYARKRWPHQRHFAVLVAESISRRLSSVIQLLGLAVPLITIQASMIDAAGNWILHFTKTLDLYEKSHFAPPEASGEPWWRAHPWNAQVFEQLVTPVMEKLELSITDGTLEKKMSFSSAFPQKSLHVL